MSYFLQAILISVSLKICGSESFMSLYLQQILNAFSSGTQGGGGGGKKILLKGVLSWSAISSYIKECILLSSETYFFLSKYEVSFFLK